MLARWLMVALIALSVPAHADGDAAPQTVVHLLDYIGADYPGAVEHGQVKSEDEFREMLEFTLQVIEQLKMLQVNPQQAQLVAEARDLAGLVAGKADATKVAELCGRLRWDVIGAYKLSVAPKGAPDLARAAASYAQHCAACHGVGGRGDGPAARGMTPPPANFGDAQRMANRSAYGLYNTITLGISGTPMQPFKQLSEDERWALAFFVADMGVPQARREEGEALWKTGEARSRFPDLVNVATLSSAEVAARYGEKAALVHGYLRAHPGELAGIRPAPLRHAREDLGRALEAYRAGEQALAQQLAVSAYLEGFELVEPALDAVDRDLRAAIETDMLRLRTLMRSGAPASEVEAHIARILEALGRADDKLGGASLSPTGAAVSAFVILLREGLEAILVLAALVAFLVKAQRRDALRYIHAGWIAALLLGIVTWFVASYAVAVSGASREMTEGVTALISTLILLYVGWWLHDKSHAKVWKQFIEEKLAGALSSRTLWALGALSFFAVYREVFEMVLFYEALWVQAGEGAHGSLVIGFALAASVLALTAWLVFRYGVRLPIGLFFKVSSVFLALLAAVFAGQGIAALQEAGAIDATVVQFPRIPSLGIFPTAQSLSVQALVLALVLAVLAWRHILDRRIRT